MDNRGVISIEYLFSIFIILIIITGLLIYSSTAMESAQNIESNFHHRLILDGVVNSINEVNSNGGGYSKNIDLEKSEYSYTITVEKNKVTIDYENKKGEALIPLLKIDNNYKLYGGHSYLISKTSDGKIVIK